MKLLRNFSHRCRIDNPHKVEAEAIDMIFLCPVIYGVLNIFPHHWTLSRNFIAYTRAVGIGAIAVRTIEIARHNFIEWSILDRIRMIVYNIHDDANASLVKRLNHLLKFSNSCNWISWV